MLPSSFTILLTFCPESSSRQHFNNSFTCSTSKVPVDASFSDPDSYDDDLNQNGRQRLHHTWHASPRSGVTSKKRTGQIRAFNAADFSTSESSPPFYENGRFSKSKSTPDIGMQHPRQLPVNRQASHSFFASNGMRQLQKSHSIGEEFPACCRDEDIIFYDCRTKKAVRSRSHGDLHYYESNSSSLDDNFIDDRDSAHYVPQVPYRTSDNRLVDDRCKMNRKRLKSKSRNEHKFFPRHFSDDKMRQPRGPGHDAGTYYGYDSEYSGAETEVFLSDRSFDRSFSQEDSEPFHELHERCGYTEEINAFPQATGPAHNVLPILERISPEIPPEKPITRPRRLVRAKTEGSLIDCLNKERRDKLDVNYAIQSNTLPLKESSTKKKKKSVKEPVSILQKSPSAARKIPSNAKQMDTRKDPHHSSRPVISIHDSCPTHSEYIHEHHDNYQNCQPYPEYYSDEEGRFASQRESFRTFKYYNQQECCERCSCSDEEPAYPHPDCCSQTFDDRRSAALPSHCLPFYSNTSACHPSKRQSYYSLDRKPQHYHPHENTLRVPVPSKAGTGFDSSATLYEPQFNTRIRPSSSVSINEQPQYFEFDANSPPNKEYRVNADVDPSSNPVSEYSQRMTGASGDGLGVSGRRGTFARSLSTGEVPETEKTGGYFVACCAACL